MEKSATTISEEIIRINEFESDLWALEKTMEAKVKRRLHGDTTLHRGEKYGILLPVI
jgi:hypothetical protein